MPKSNIALLGFMGTGKSAVGRLTAQRLGHTYIDMDTEIEHRVGKPITRIFEEDGEPSFRAMEAALVEELAERRRMVISTGGGIVLNPDNVRRLEASGLVVCLRASPETILARVEHDTSRPLLAVEDKLQRIRELLEKRRSRYDAVSVRIDTDPLSVEETAEEVIRLFNALQEEKEC